MIKDTKYIIKRVIIGVLIFLILSFIRTCEVQALNAIQSISLNYNREITSGSGTLFNIFTSNNTLKNYGRGVLQFTLVTYSYSETTSHLNNTVRDVIVQSGQNLYTCSLGTATNEFNNDTDYLVNLYSVLCDVNLGANGLEKIDVHMVYNLSTKYTLKSSTYLTFISDMDVDNGAKLDVINNTLATYLQSVYNATSQVATNTTATNNYLSAIQVLLNTNLTAIIQALTSSTSQIVTAQQQTTTAVEDNTQAVNDVNDTLNDSSTDDPSSDISSMNSHIATNSVISDLLLLPVTLFQNILNSINGTCSTFNLGSLFGTNLTMPCIDIESIIGSALWGVIDILLCGLFVLAMRKKFVDIFQNITSLKDGGNQVE